MFLIAVSVADVSSLDAGGVDVTINGKKTLLSRDGDYLCYDDNRCKVFESFTEGDLVQFVAASHGDEGEPHCIVNCIVN